MLGDGLPPSAALCALVVAALVPMRPAAAGPAPWTEFLAALPRRLACVAATGLFLRYQLELGLAGLWFGAVWPAVACLAELDWARIGAWFRGPRWIHRPAPSEFLRCAFLLCVALWLMQGFFRATLHGTPDANWYALNLADAVAQVRAGVFPVFVGQSVYQFNGAMCPIRVAPAFHYLGALLDALTLHSLGIFALQNLLITLVGVCGMFSAYLGLRALLPGRHWLAAGLATLFLSCPGVLGLAYNMDLYMSWMTLPMVPLAWFATVRSFQDRGSAGTLSLLGASLGLCWWGHPPIALWSTALAAGAQLARLWVQGRGGLGLRPILAGALAFGSIAAYPVCSVLLFPPEPGAHADLFQVTVVRNIVFFLQRVFPAAFLPLSATGRSQGDFQVGYSIWAVLAASLWSERSARRPFAAAPLACAALLALLILPIPGLSQLLWRAVPAFLRNTTGNWAMSRLCLPLAGATVFAAAACASSGPAKAGLPGRLFAILVAAGCVWSLSEAGKFAAGSRRSVFPPESAADMLRSENVQITRYSYSMFPHFPALPRNFTHGVADPGFENGLLSRDSLARIATNADAALASAHLESASEFSWDLSSRSDCAELEQRLRIEPGRFYLLQFDFARPDATSGVLQIDGPHLFREYGLPEHGGSRAFGAGAEHTNVIPISTTADAQELLLRFFPSEPIPTDRVAPPVANVRLLSYDSGALPVRVDSWIPYRARVRSPEDAWLETPRVFQTGYEARVNGSPAAVRESPDALVAVAVPRGESTVELAYVAPPGLRLLFWLSFLAAIVSAAFGASGLILHLLRTRAPAKASEAVQSAP